MATATVNYIGETIEDNGRILAMAARVLSEQGGGVRLAPFRDDLVVRIGVWIEGDAEQVRQFTTRLDDLLSDEKIPYSSLPWTRAAERG